MPARLIAGLLALQLLLVALFVLPGHDPKPRGVPTGVVGTAALPPVFETHRYATTEEAIDAIEAREVYGAVAGRTVLVASAASPTVAQLLGEAAPGATVRDVVPIAKADPRGATINLAILPLIVVTIPLALLLARLPRARLLAAVAGFAAASGLLAMAFVSIAMDALPGSYLALSAVAALAVLAVALPVAGLVRLLGPPGAGLGALLFVAVGNPGSGNATAPELLPGFWRVAGPLLPPGAGGQVLRTAAYFDASALVQPLLVLTAWAAAGAALIVLARRRSPSAAPEPLPSTPRVAVPA
jgi:hypothetical protein